MFKIFAIFIFYAMIGSIISPDQHNPVEKDGKVDGVIQSSHEYSSTHSTAPVPPTIIKEEHAGGDGQIVTSDPHHPTPPNPIIDYPLMNWLKKKTSYAKPIENVQKSSNELLKDLHSFVLHEIHKKFPEVEAFKTEQKVDGSKVKASFDRLIQDVKGLRDHDMDQKFRHTRSAYSSLKEDPNDEHRQKQMKQALVSDVSSGLSGLFINPVTASEKLFRHMGWIGDDDGAKQNHNEHETKDDKSGHKHDQDHDVDKNGHSTEHSEHGVKPSLVSDPNHNHSDPKIEPKNPDHEHRHGEEVHTKEKHIDHTNSGHHQGDAPPQRSVLEGLVETFFTYVPIQNLFTYVYLEMIILFLILKRNRDKKDALL